MSAEIRRKEIKFFVENWGDKARFVAEVDGVEIASADDMETLFDLIYPEHEAFNYENMKEDKE